MTRISTLDSGYVTGQLSNFPQAKDDATQLYVATNNAETTLLRSLTYTGQVVIVEDTTNFPDNGLLRIGPPPGQAGSAELIAYATKTSNTFQNLQRGFAGSRQNQWGQGAYVTGGVGAEIHNAEKDAIIQIENNLGLANLPTATSLNGILKQLEVRFLSPKPLFRAYPIVGPPPLMVRFQNFSSGQAIRFLWDFGDGGRSVNKSTTYTYKAEGVYSVKLNMLTTTGAQGVVEKTDYITVSNDQMLQFFYVLPTVGYSISTAQTRTMHGNPTDPTTFNFVDQTGGQIAQRYWVFGDNDYVVENDGNVHTTSHQYQNPGEYDPSLLSVMADLSQRRVFLQEKIIVL